MHPKSFRMSYRRSSGYSKYILQFLSNNRDHGNHRECWPRRLENPLTCNSASFDWSSTTPLPDVGSYIQNAFWNCGKDFSLISSRGFVPLDNVRVSSDDLSFIEELPIVPEPLLQFGLIKRLRAGDVLSDVQIEDIVTILEKSKKTRTPVQLVSQKTALSTMTNWYRSNNF